MQEWYLGWEKVSSLIKNMIVTISPPPTLSQLTPLTPGTRELGDARVVQVVCLSVHTHSEIVTELVLTEYSHITFLETASR